MECPEYLTCVQALIFDGESTIYIIKLPSLVNRRLMSSYVVLNFFSKVKVCAQQSEFMETCLLRNGDGPLSSWSSSSKLWLSCRLFCRLPKNTFFLFDGCFASESGSLWTSTFCSILSSWFKLASGSVCTWFVPVCLLKHKISQIKTATQKIERK